MLNRITVLRATLPVRRIHITTANSDAGRHYRVCSQRRRDDHPDSGTASITIRCNHWAGIGYSDNLGKQAHVTHLQCHIQRLVDCDISGLTMTQGNSATSTLNAGLGGAIYSSGTLVLSNDVFSSDTGNDGGAVLSTGVLTSANNTFSGNSATSYGGALFNSGTLTSTNDTFSGNSAANGGGIENLSLLTIVHDTFTTNLATAQGAVDNEGTAVSGKHFGQFGCQSTIQWGRCRHLQRPEVDQHQRRCSTIRHGTVAVLQRQRHSEHRERYDCH